MRRKEKKPLIPLNPIFYNAASRRRHPGKEKKKEFQASKRAKNKIGKQANRQTNKHRKAKQSKSQVKHTPTPVQNGHALQKKKTIV